MFLDFESSGSAEPLERVLMQQRRDDVLGLRRHRPIVLLRPLDVVVDGVSKQFFGGLAEEGDAADEELVEDDAHAPPVHRLAVALPQDHLRGNVFRRSKHLE